MDLNDYWQENKRFVTTVALGVFAFVIAELAIGSLIGDELRSTRASLNARRRDLAEPRFGAAQLDAAREQNEALRAALAVLEDRVAFRPRSGFALEAGTGSATGQYFSRVTEVREALVREAGRLAMRLPEDLGLPALAPTRAEEIERHLAALDVIERVVRLAFQAGVPRVERIDIRLDPGLGSRRGVGAIERTQVRMRMSGPSDALVRLLAASQGGEGQPLLIEEVEMAPERSKADEARLDVIFVVSRVAAIDAGEV
jgi:hypothetical protein